MYIGLFTTGPRMIGFLYCVSSGNQGTAVLVCVFSEKNKKISFIFSSLLPLVNVINHL